MSNKTKRPRIDYMRTHRISVEQIFIQIREKRKSECAIEEDICFINPSLDAVVVVVIVGFGFVEQHYSSSRAFRVSSRNILFIYSTSFRFWSSEHKIDFYSFRYERMEGASCTMDNAHFDVSIGSLVAARKPHNHIHFFY